MMDKIRKRDIFYHFVDAQGIRVALNTCTFVSILTPLVVIIPAPASSLASDIELSGPVLEVDLMDVMTTFVSI